MRVIVALVAVGCCVFPVAAHQARAGAACGAIDDAVELVPVGAFSNVRRNEEPSGYSLRVWRAGGCPVGLFTVQPGGLAEDPPIAMLENGTFDAPSGRLAFSATLSTGAIATGRQGIFVRSEDHYLFEGTLRANEVSGALTHTERQSPGRPSRTTIVLPTSDGLGEFVSTRRTYGEWMRLWQPVIAAVRGAG
jgi:hypothetical protein